MVQETEMIKWVDRLQRVCAGLGCMITIHGFGIEKKRSFGVCEPAGGSCVFYIIVVLL
jgi:hypothetical protein